MPRKQWYPAFVAAIREIVKDAPPEQVEVVPEAALSSKPLDVDELVEPGVMEEVLKMARRMPDRSGYHQSKEN
ncbi:MAG: hypothetical protein AB1556_16275 [Bacillota bacterium]